VDESGETGEHGRSGDEFEQRSDQRKQGQKQRGFPAGKQHTLGYLAFRNLALEDDGKLETAGAPDQPIFGSDKAVRFIHDRACSHHVRTSYIHHSNGGRSARLFSSSQSCGLCTQYINALCGFRCSQCTQFARSMWANISTKFAKSFNQFNS
jgi:hypothetical protein